MIAANAATTAKLRLVNFRFIGFAFSFAAALSTGLASTAVTLGRRIELWHYRLRTFSEFACPKARQMDELFCDNCVSLLVPCRSPGISRAQTSDGPGSLVGKPAVPLFARRDRRVHFQIGFSPVHDRLGRGKATQHKPAPSFFERCKRLILALPSTRAAPFASGPLGHNRNACYSLALLLR